MSCGELSQQQSLQYENAQIPYSVVAKEKALKPTAFGDLRKHTADA